MKTQPILLAMLSFMSSFAILACENGVGADQGTESDSEPLSTSNDSVIGEDTQTASHTQDSTLSTDDTDTDGPQPTASDTEPETVETDSCELLLASEPPPPWEQDAIAALLFAFAPPPDSDSASDFEPDTTTESDVETLEETDSLSDSIEETESFDTLSSTGAETDSETATQGDSETEETLSGGLAGWNILAPSYPANNNLDLLSFEWDYFMVHDKEGKFTGSIGYLIANPRNSTIFIPGMADLVPAGGNTAIAGKFEGGSPSANYHNFRSNYQASGKRRYFEGVEPGTDLFAALIPVPENNALLLQGQTEDFAWDLVVTQDWPELTGEKGNGAFEPVTGRDVGNNAALALLGGEVWTVDMLWPRTKIVGTITDLSDPLDPVTVTIDGHGYRENSHGRWAFNAGGWDFGVVSDEASQVMWTWQTYHHASTKLDFADVAFYDGDELVIAHFNSNEKQLGWFHEDWRFHSGARQCMPRSAEVLAVNEDYIVEARLDIGDNQVPMLSNATAATRAYVIQILFPMISGTIKRRATGEVITTFAGQGGGEFSVSRQPASVSERSDDWCYCWGREKFSSPMPTL
jgi:hypothetical protein